MIKNFKIVLLFVLLFCNFSLNSQEVEFLIPVPATSTASFPNILEDDIVLITSFDGRNIDELSYILKSEETGFYPSYGWTGEYYITGVTHGEVFDIDNMELVNYDFDAREFSVQGRSVPEPFSLSIFGLLILRRKHVYN